MKNNFFSSLLLTAILLLFFSAPGLFAQNTTQSANFSTSQQDWYKAGTSANTGKDYLFNSAIQNFVTQQIGPNDLNVTTKLGYAFDVYSDTKKMDGGKVDINFPLKINYSYPADRTYGCGEEIAISTSCTVDPGYKMTTLPPVYEMELGVKAKAGFAATYTTPFSGGGTIVDLPAGFVNANAGNYESLMAGSESPFFGLNTQTGISWPWQYNGGVAPNPPPSNSLPLIIPGFVTNLAKLSGTINAPFDTNPADLISGKTISETSTRKFLDLQFDPIQFQEYLTGFSMRKTESIPGVLSLEYTLFSLPFDFDVYRTQKLKFEPSVDIQLQLNRIYDWRVRDESNNIVQTGTSNQVTMKAGHTLLLSTKPDNFQITMTPTYKMNNQFTTQIRDSVQVSLDLKALGLTVKSPGLEICNPFDSEDCITIGAINESIGPVVDLNFDITNFAVDAYAQTTFEMPGFADIQGATITLHPDDTPPVATYTNPSLALDANGQVTVNSISQVTSSIVDQDGGTVQILNQPSKTFTCADLGPKTYAFTLTDGRCNGTVYNAPVNIVDNMKPTVLTVAPFELQLNASGQASLTTTQIDNGSYDNCTVVSRSISKTSFTCADLGANTITLTVTDQSGNSQTGNVAVTVADRIAPSVVCKNFTANLDANGNATVTTANVFQSGADNCGVVVQESVLPATFNCGNLGANIVTLRVNDSHGNTATCSATVTVEDKVAPTVVCKPVTVFLDANGQAGITTASVFQSGADNCGIVNQESVLPNAFTCSNLGANTVTLKVNDSHGNTATCTATVTVKDNIAPTLLCKNATIFLDANGQAGVTVAQINNGSYDNCTITLMGLSQLNFNCANLGDNPVKLTGTDQSGNKAECNAIVTVKDAIAPTAVCKNLTVLLNGEGEGSISAAQVNNGSTDNCSVTSMTVTPAAFNCSNVGLNNSVTLKVTDQSGNSSNCSALITVKDQFAPTALCKNPTVYLDDNGYVSITAATVNNGSFDACGIASLSINVNEFFCSKTASPRPVFLTVTDLHNNVSTCTAMVTVKDALAPTAVCENVTVQLNAQGKATVYGAQLADESYDNCNVWSYAPVSKQYTTANVGMNNLTITVKDWSGNPATCIAHVNVVAAGGGALIANNSHNIEDAADGAEAGQAEERIEAAPAVATELTVFPNPSAGMATLQFQLPAGQSVALQLFDLSGRLVMSRELEGQKGRNHVPLDLGEMPSGLYLIEVRTDALRMQKRLSVQHD